jgi:predicted membrane-bound dolichyl-phosphate-mannose-protein mannosyltransferase
MEDARALREPRAEDWARSAPRKASRPVWMLVGLLASVFLLHLLIIDLPKKAYVFDEAHYVPAARCLLEGRICNVEHPPLAKALIALGILAFGDNGFGWRLPSVLAGTFALLLVFLITRRFSDDNTALLAAFLLGFENLWFIHSSIAMLDIIAFFFALAGLYFFLRERYALAGLALGVGMLAKEVVFIVVLVLGVFTLLRQDVILSWAAFRSALRAGLVVGLVAAATFLVGLGFYDAAFDAFPSPFHHVARMVRHNQAIDSPRMSDTVHPLRWFSGFPDAPYFVTSVEVKGASIKRTIMQYLGQANLVVLLFAWLSLPLVWPAVKKKSPLALLCVLLIAIPYAFFVAVAAARVTYPFYMLVFTPFLCIVNALGLMKLPRTAVAVFCVAVVAWFFYWFPRNPLAPF